MKTSKRILIIIVFLIITSAISALLSIPALIFGYSFWYSFFFFMGIQPLGKYLYDRYVEVNILIDTRNQLLEKPYKEEILGVNCAICNTAQEIPFNLQHTEFRCLKCQRLNSIHTTVSVQAVTEAINPIEHINQLRKIRDN